MSRWRRSRQVLHHRQININDIINSSNTGEQAGELLFAASALDSLNLVSYSTHPEEIEGEYEAQSEQGPDINPDPDPPRILFNNLTTAANNHHLSEGSSPPSVLYVTPIIPMSICALLYGPVSYYLRSILRRPYFHPSLPAPNKTVHHVPFWPLLRCMLIYRCTVPLHR